MDEAKHDNLLFELELNTDHFVAVTFINGEIFVDTQVEGVTEKIAMIDQLEKVIETLKGEDELL
jgi:hypothetical protein